MSGTGEIFISGIDYKSDFLEYIMFSLPRVRISGMYVFVTKIRLYKGMEADKCQKQFLILSREVPCKKIYHQYSAQSRPMSREKTS